MSRDDGRRPAPGPRPPVPVFAEPEPERGFKHLRWRRRRRKARKKSRLAAMTRGRRWLRRGMIGGTWLLSLVAAGMVALIVMYYAFTDVPRPESLPLPQVATIQYSDGSTLARIGTVDRTIVDIDQVPARVRWAILAAEDRNFYNEGAVSITGTGRAAVSDLTGGDTQGGSGITQQYVKNAYLSDSQTLTRKLRELMIAVKLSRNYDKDQILGFYLNTVYFGRGAYGIQAAAEAYFGVPVGKLTTAQGAVLAAVLRAPSYYDPAVNRAQATARWHYVLDGMVATKHLTQQQDDAMVFPKTRAPSDNTLSTKGWKYLLTNRVLAELQAHGISTDEVYKKGLTIRTTIDKKAQAAAVSAIHTTFAHLTKKQRNLKNALVAINPGSGGVLAYYGGSGPGVKGNDGKIDFNDYASGGARPAGSSFKPYTLATTLTQTLKQTPGKDHVAINSLYDGSRCRTIDGTKICNDPGDDNISGPRVTITNAMKYSLNTTFDLLAFDAGPDDVAATAHAMGIAATNPDGTKSLVDKDGQTNFGIGIGNYPVTVMGQANGFATLADGGTYNPAYLVQQAASSQGDVVYRHSAHPEQVIDKKVANDVAITMKGVAGYSGDALANGRKSAAKTGTVGLNPKTTANSDAWMVGFTPQVSAAVWVGSGRNEPIVNSAGQPLYGSNLPGQTWKLFMDTYLHGTKHAKLPTKQQIAPDGKAPKPKPTITYTPAPSLAPSTQPVVTPSAPPSSSSPPSTSPPPPPSVTPSAPSTSVSTSPDCGGLLQPPCPP